MVLRDIVLLWGVAAGCGGCLRENPDWDGDALSAASTTGESGTSTTSTGGSTTITASSSAGPSGGTTGLDPSGSTADATGTPTPQANIAFVTSLEVVAGDLGGVSGADEVCSKLAATAGLPGTYVAWISDATSDAIDRLGDARGWVRPDGKPVVDVPTDLEGVGPYYPISIDETGMNAGAQTVFTGTGSDGRAHVDRCNDWTSTEANGRQGYSDAVTLAYTSGQSQLCDVPGRLYCFGADAVAELAFEPAEGRHAFVSFATSGGDQGLAAYDARCNTEAEAAGLPGSYLAFMASTAQTPISRFDTDGPPWINPRGVPLVSAAESLLVSDDLDVPVAFTAAGAVPPADAVWTGAGTPVQAGSRCSDWTDMAELGVYGFSNRAASFTDDGVRPCDRGHSVLCFQQ